MNTLRHILYSCAAMFLVLPGAGLLGATVELARDGKSPWRVALPERTGIVEKFARDELCKYFEQMTGVKLGDAGVEAKGPVIRLGLRNDLPAAQGLPAATSGYDGYSVLVSEQSIMIAGDNARGVVYGMYDLLERLGCRWCYPTQDPRDPEVVPKASTLAIETGAWSMASPMRFRICNGSSWYFDMDLDAARRQLEWGMKNRYNTIGCQTESKTTLVAQFEKIKSAGLIDELDKRGMMLHGPAHSFDHFLKNELYFDKHPEWFGMRDGKRVPQAFVGAQFCWSNAEARKQFTDNVEAFVRACPRFNILCIVPFDGGRACTCPECTKVGPSNALMTLMREVIDRLEKVSPDLLVETVGGYEPMTEPPTGVEIHPKQRIIWAHWGRYYGEGYGDPKYGRRDNLEKWIKAARGGITLCQYYTDNFAEPWILPPFTISLIGDRQYFLEKKIDSVYMLMWSPGYWWNHSLNGYLSGRCFYDVSLDPYKELQDYAMHYYGKDAGPLIGAYYEQWARNVDLAYRVKGDTRDSERAMLAEQRQKMIDPAVEAAKKDPVYAYRVSKVANLHTLAEKLAEGQRMRQAIVKLRQGQKFDDAERGLAAARSYIDGILAYFNTLADLKQGLIDKNEIPGFITLGVKNWLDEEAKAITEAREEAKLDNVEPAFVNPVYEGADPWVIRHDGQYYFCQSEGDMAISVWKSDRLTDMGVKRIVWKPKRGQWNSREVWAPELHYLRGKWYIYYAADDGKNANHRCGVLEAVTGDPQGEYVDKGMLYTGDDVKGKQDNRWAIDATPLELGDKLYVIWSGWPAKDDVQYLYIATMSNPYTVAGNRVKLCENNTYVWERVSDKPTERGLHEGPQILKRSGKVFIVYSCSSSWESTYKLGMLYMDEKADPMNPASWTKADKPVFAGTPQVFGVGHASFTTSPDGSQDWIVYHAKISREPGWQRAVSLKPFGWTKDGMPDFGTPVPPGKTQAAPAGEPTNRKGETYRDSFERGNWDNWVYYGYRRYIDVENQAMSIGVVPRWGLVNQFHSGEKALVRGLEWSDVSVTTRVRIEKGDRDAGLLFRVRRPAVGYDAQRGYFAGIVPGSKKVTLGRTDGHAWTQIAIADCPVSAGQWCMLRVEAKGDTIRVFVDDVLRITAKDSTYTHGMVGVRVVDTHAVFDDFEAAAIR